MPSDWPPRYETVNFAVMSLAELDDWLLDANNYRDAWHVRIVEVTRVRDAKAADDEMRRRFEGLSEKDKAALAQYVNVRTGPTGGG